MVGLLDDYLRDYSDRCQIDLSGDVVVIVTESSGRDFSLSVMDSGQEIFETV